MRAPHLLALSFALAACADGDAPRPPQSSRCVSCHRAEYERTHAHERGSRKPATCAVCHIERAWHPTSVRHEWPLTGVHEDAHCVDCHKGAEPIYEGTPTACVGCHRAEYDRAVYPPHGRLAVTCADCHDTNAWAPARNPDASTPTPATPDASAEPARPSTPERPATQHRPVARPTPAPTPAPTPTPPPTPTPSPAPDAPAHPESRFPIARGNHADIRCQRCHNRPGPDGRDNTDCVQCHPRSRFDDIHSRVRQYPGSSSPNFCVRCHGRGTRSRR